MRHFWLVSAILACAKPSAAIRTKRETTPFAQENKNVIDNIATHFLEDELRYYKFPGRPATNINLNTIDLDKPLLQRLAERSFKIPVVTIGHVDNIPGRGNRVGIRSQVELLDKGANKLMAWIQFQREFYKNRVAVPSTVYGVTYQHRDGGEVVFSAAHGADNRPVGTLDVNWPIIGNRRANVGVAAGVTFGQGIKTRPYINGRFNFRPKFQRD